MQRMNWINKLFLISAFLLTLSGCAPSHAKQQQLAANAKDENTFTVEKMGMSFAQVQEAASQGDPDAQYALGYLYYYGKGTTRDENEARFWIKKAAAQGQPEASKALALLGETNTQVAKAETKAEAKPTSLAKAEAKSKPDLQLADNDVLDTANNPAAEEKPADVAKTSEAAKSAGLDNAAKVSMEQPTSSAKPTGNYYTLQLLGAYEKEQVLSFLRNNHLGKDASYVQTTHNGKTWYVAIYGAYQTQQEAMAAIKQLPANVQKDHPWVKPMAASQQGMQVAAADE